MQRNISTRSGDLLKEESRKEKKDVHKILVCSFEKSFKKNDRKRMEEKGIKILEIGFQVLPEDYYAFFKKKGKILSRKIEDIHTFEETKEIIETELKNISAFLIPSPKK